jgi:hypothetical protein
MLNLQIHLRERFLHVLHVLDCHLYQLTPMPDDGSYGAYVRFGPEGGAQQSHRVQVLQPLAFMPVGSPSRNVFHVARIGQARLDSMRFQNVVQRNPPTFQKPCTADSRSRGNDQLKAKLLRPLGERSDLLLAIPGFIVFGSFVNVRVSVFDEPVE